MSGVALAAIAVAFVAAGCVGTSPPGGASGVPSAGSSAAPSEEPSMTDGFSAVVLDPILADAAKRTGLGITDLEVESAEERTWPDGSWGCPQPGMAYTQMVVDGYRVIIRAGERTLDYRGSGPGHFRLCEQVAPSPS